MRDFIRIHIEDADREKILAEASNPLEEIYYQHSGNIVYKWHHYLELYHHHFKRFRGYPVRILELGVMTGGSLQLWRSYFGEAAIIHGIDINPVPIDCAKERVVTHLGSQTDEDLLKRVVEEMGGIDILIDDASHIGKDQITTFEMLYHLLDTNGIYLCEDTRSSYWNHFEGGLRRPGTFIEYTKELIDRLHSWYVEDESFASDETIARTTHSISIYDSMIVIEKKDKKLPFQYLVGHRPDKDAP